MKRNKYSEGKISQRTIKAYERDKNARAMAIAIHGCSCYICNFSFENTYGDLGKGFIHVHHITPISIAAGKEYKIDPNKDLIPVCPNCHAMLHREKETKTPEEIKAILRNHTKKDSAA